MDILDDMGVSKLSAKVFSKVNYFNISYQLVVFKFLLKFCGLLSLIDLLAGSVYPHPIRGDSGRS